MPFERALIGARFDKAATSYDTHAWVQQEIAKRLVEKLSLLKKTPTQILDLGQGTGVLCRMLQDYYQASQPKLARTMALFGLDLSHHMCQVAKQKFAPTAWGKFTQAFSAPKTPKFIQADAHALPFLGEKFDLLVSNCVFQWCEDLPRLFQECHRVLTLKGSLFFSSFGPDSLQELKACTQKISAYTHVHDFMDMHEIGDFLLKNKFSDPIVEMEKITSYYPNVSSLLLDLKKIGATNQHAKRPKGLMGKNWLKQLESHYEPLRSPQGLPVTWEVIYGHATKTTPHPITRQGPEGKLFTSVQRL